MLKILPAYLISTTKPSCSNRTGNCRLGVQVIRLYFLSIQQGLTPLNELKDELKATNNFAWNERTKAAKTGQRQLSSRLNSCLR